MCRNNGSFSFEGTTTATIEKDILFNLTVSYPDTIFACKLPRVLKGEVIEIECLSSCHSHSSFEFLFIINKK